MTWSPQSSPRHESHFEEIETISSAVFIPDSISTTLGKRSFPSPPEAQSKRTRLDKEPSKLITESGDHNSSRTYISRHRLDEEKARGRRLFGAAFGALTQRSTSNDRRRAEIESKQRKKLLDQRREIVRKRSERLTGTSPDRETWQFVLGSESSRSHGSPLPVLPHFLRTRSKPEIFYLPFKLRSQEQERIRQQISASESHAEDQDQPYTPPYAALPEANHYEKSLQPPQPRDSNDSPATLEGQGEKGGEKLGSGLNEDYSKEVVDDNEEIQVGLGEDSVIY